MSWKEFLKFLGNKSAKLLKRPAKPAKTVAETVISEKGLNSKVASFADDTLLFRVINESWLWRFAGDPYDAKGIIKQEVRLNA